MKIKFIGVPGEDHQSIPSFGYVFPLGKFVDVTDSYAISVLRNHPHFEAQGVDAQDVESRDVAPVETLADFLDRTVADILPALPKLTDSQLNAIVEAETAGKNRKGVLDAVEAEQKTRAEA